MLGDVGLLGCLRFSLICDRRFSFGRLRRGSSRLIDGWKVSRIGFCYDWVRVIVLQKTVGRLVGSLVGRVDGRRSYRKTEDERNNSN